MTSTLVLAISLYSFYQGFITHFIWMGVGIIMLAYFISLLKEKILGLHKKIIISEENIRIEDGKVHKVIKMEDIVFVELIETSLNKGLLITLDEDVEEFYLNGFDAKQIYEEILNYSNLKEKANKFADECNKQRQDMLTELRNNPIDLQLSSGKILNKVMVSIWFMILISLLMSIFMKSPLFIIILSMSLLVVSYMVAFLIEYKFDDKGILYRCFIFRKFYTWEEIKCLEYSSKHECMVIHIKFIKLKLQHIYFDYKTVDNLKLVPLIFEIKKVKVIDHNKHYRAHE